jgi:hypothetical protein
MLGFYSCSRRLLLLTLGPSPSIVRLCRRCHHMMILRMVIVCVIPIIRNSVIMTIIGFILISYHYTFYSYYTRCSISGWLESVGSRIVVPVGDTRTMQRHLLNVFPGASGDRRQGAGDGCRMWFVNSWALGWSQDM